MIELPKIEVNQNEANQVPIVIGIFKPNNVLSAKIDAIGLPIKISATRPKIKTYCIINPIKF